MSNENSPKEINPDAGKMVENGQAPPKKPAKPETGQAKPDQPKKEK